MKPNTSQEKYTNYVMKPNFKGGYPICCRDGEKQNQDKQTSVPWASNFGRKQDFILCISSMSL